MLYVPFALLGSKNVFMSFSVDEPVQPIALCETVRNARAMLPGTPWKIGGGPDVESGHSADWS